MRRAGRRSARVGRLRLPASCAGAGWRTGAAPCWPGRPCSPARPVPARLCARPARLALAGPPPWPAALRADRRRQRHRGAVAQPVGAVGHHLLAGLQARQHRLVVAVGRPDLHRAHRDRVVRVDDVDVTCPGSPRCTAGTGTRTASCIVFTSSRALTNWFGYSLFVRIGEHRAQLQRAGGRVDLVVQVSKAARSPAASRWPGHRPRPLSVAPARSRWMISGRLSSGTEKITEIGCIWVITTMPVVPLVWT